MEPIILASSSMGRQSILKFLKIPFVVDPAQIDETIPEGVKIEDAPELLAVKKVNAAVRKIAPQHKIPWILAADTLVILDGKVLGKPENQQEAKEYLKRLQGTVHQVITGIALFNGELFTMDSRTSVNRVTFAPMDDDEIDTYLETSEWHGAAGGYRIQGMASCYITRIEGTESSVVGLPIQELYDMLRRQSYRFTV